MFAGNVICVQALQVWHVIYDMYVVIIEQTQWVWNRLGVLQTQVPQSLQPSQMGQFL